MGIDNQTGQARFAFGVPQLLDGIEVVTVAVGLFAVGETIYAASKLHSVKEEVERISGLHLDEGGRLEALHRARGSAAR